MQLPENIKHIINSSLPLVISIFLFILVGNFGISKILEIRGQINQASADQNVLSQKVTLLQSVQTTISGSSNAAAVALPDSNTTLAVLSQLKNFGIINGTVLNNIKAGSPAQDPTGLSRVDISFDISGTPDQVATYLKGLSGLAPIMVVGSIKINESTGVEKATTVVRSFWAALPKTLPTSTQSISGLSSDEQNVLSTVNKLTPPTFTAIPASAGAGKTNPFE